MKVFSILKGFTLAEVLITLGIIGVVAAITIPTVLQNSQTQATVSALKKSYTTLSQAYAQAAKDNGTVDTWDITGTQGALNIFNTLVPYLNLTKNCGYATGCFPSSAYRNLMGDVDTTNASFDSNASYYYAKAQLADGTLLAIRSYGSCGYKGGDSSLLQNVCAEAFVDVNGFKQPNQVGVDLFEFYIGTNGLVPMGTKTETSNTFANNCKNKATDGGWACAAWVLYNENMDYLNCNNLNWNGPTKCN